VPTLRNIALTFPYMHDGSMATLEEVIAHYNSGGKGSLNQSPLIRKLKLSHAEQKALLSFLKTLSDKRYEK
jgi:cytochrome c peroxidase